MRLQSWQSVVVGMALASIASRGPAQGEEKPSPGTPPTGKVTVEFTGEEKPPSGNVRVEFTSDEEPVKEGEEKAARIYDRLFINEAGNVDSVFEIKVAPKVHAAVVAHAGKQEMVKEIYIGVATSPVPEILAAQLPSLFRKGQGLVVNQVIPDSPAAKAGLQKNDILSRYEDQILFSPDQFKKLVTGEKKGQKVTLEVVREGKPIKVAVELDERDAPRMAAFNAAMPWTFNPKIDGFDFSFPHFQPTPPIPHVHPVPPHVAKGIDFIRRADAKANTHAKTSVQSVTIENKDGQFTITATFQADGKPETKTIKGTADEILKQLDQMPAELRDKIKSAVEQSRDKKKVSPPGAVELKLFNAPTDAKNTTGLKLWFSKTGKDGAIETKLIDGANIEAIQGEIKALPINVRANVEESLKRIEVPNINIEFIQTQ